LSSHWVTFQLDGILERPPAVQIPLLVYLLSRIERSLGKHPTFITLDEVWRAFSNKTLLEWLLKAIRTFRMREGRTLLATQDVAQLALNKELLISLRSAISFEIYGADKSLSTPAVVDIYRNVLNLSDAELVIISQKLTPARDYYLRVPSRGSRRFPLDAGPALRAFVGMTSEADQQALAHIEQTRPRADWARAILEHKNLHGALGELDRYEASAASEVAA
ncbi:MAG TPA: hypothetical protein VMF89_02060, partial [Polyangiales bacterium]|nr:hypothetical protein [Polyangiales bacterium]